jgi:hypothetical protein
MCHLEDLVFKVRVSETVRPLRSQSNERKGRRDTGRREPA